MIITALYRILPLTRSLPIMRRTNRDEGTGHILASPAPGDDPSPLLWSTASSTEYLVLLHGLHPDSLLAAQQLLSTDLRLFLPSQPQCLS